MEASVEVVFVKVPSVEASVEVVEVDSVEALMELPWKLRP